MAQAESFDWSRRKNGDVVISHHGRVATTLRGRRADGDGQELMARLAGNYKRGNERDSRNHPTIRLGDDRRSIVASQSERFGSTRPEIRSILRDCPRQPPEAARITLISSLLPQGTRSEGRPVAGLLVFRSALWDPNYVRGE